MNRNASDPSTVSEETPPAGGTISTYRLEDAYAASPSRVFLSGTQAMVRLVFEAMRHDREQQRRTAAFVSGYPGSPLGGLDQEFARRAEMARDLAIVHVPGHNEELAATAVWGSQVAPQIEGAEYEGVLGIWYGKGPGLDRASDAIRHAQYVGTSPRGGVLALVGDDPSCKSSSLPNSSEQTLCALGVPTMAPGDVIDLLELGAHGIAMSRASGLWSAMRVVTSVADATATVDTNGQQLIFDDGRENSSPTQQRVRGIPGPPWSIEAEDEVLDARLAAAADYSYRHSLNVPRSNPRKPWLAIVAIGHLYREVASALTRLGLTIDRLEGLGIRVVHVRAPYPMDKRFVIDTCADVEDVIVVEEKRSFVETFLKESLYGTASMPRIVGKYDLDGLPLFPPIGVLTADSIVQALFGQLRGRIGAEQLIEPARPRARLKIVEEGRKPFFCAGCPHNSSVRVPEGALVGGGIGCHGMTQFMEREFVGDLLTTTHMGAEGAQWIGIAPFVSKRHMFQNMGDGTYFHSGQLAVQAAVAAGTTITYKLLFNGAIAMTGGQSPAESNARPVADVADMLLRQGVRRIIITTEEVKRFRGVRLPRSVQVWDRARIVEAQETLREVPGVTVLIHDQRCAAENRRDRKRGRLSQPRTRVLINERVCEGCGDCGVKSNCLAVEPVETEFGRKTAIAQDTCNLDYSCLKGDCPSFVTVRLRKGHRDPSTSLTGVRQEASAPASRADLPRPSMFFPERSVTIRMPGVGGTGVVTTSQVLATAAMLDGLHTIGLDQTGLSQKAGPVVSDLRISPMPIDGSNRAADRSIDVLLGFDLLGACSDETLNTVRDGKTVAVISTSQIPTGQMVSHSEIGFPDDNLIRAEVAKRVAPARLCWVDHLAETQRRVGSGVPANIFLVGVAYQFGALPISPEAIERAITLNGVAVETNLIAFRAGRSWMLGQQATPSESTVPESMLDPTNLTPALQERVSRLARDLVDYQDERYAERYTTKIAAVAAAETKVVPGSSVLGKAAAESLYKLMAYKDEYEVARLCLDPALEAKIAEEFGPGATFSWNLHPPVLRALGLRRKIRLGLRWRPVFLVLRRLRSLRGTRADLFAYTSVRRAERKLIDEYMGVLDLLTEHLDGSNIDRAVEIAELPQQIRGYEELKLQRISTYREELERQMERYISSPLL